MVLEKNMLKNEKKMNKTNLRTIKTHSQDHHNAVPGPLKNMLKNEKKVIKTNLRTIKNVSRK